MAFSSEEKAIIDWSIKNGKSVQEMKDAIFRYRTTGSPQDPNKLIQSQPSYRTQVKEAASAGLEKTIEGVADVAKSRNPLTLTEGLLKTGAGAIETVTSPLAPALAPIGKGIEAVSEKVAEIPAVQRFADSPAGEIASRAAEDVLNLSTIGGAVLGLRSIPRIPRAKNGDVPEKAPEIKAPTASSVKTFIENVRFNLSNIDPQVENVLQRSSFDEVNRYFQQARTHKGNVGKPTAMELSNTKTVEAYDLIDEARSAAVQGKKNILARVSDNRISGNAINETMASGIQRFNTRFGANVDADGTVTQAKGRTLQLDASDTKLVSDYFSRLNKLGVSPTLQQVDDFVDWAQGQLYKQSKTVSKFEVASEPVIGELRSITGDLNTRLKTSVGGGYAEVNARIGKLIELQDELSRALGADARKGAGLLKRLFSPAGGDTRRILQEIYDETGIDLVKEATLAKYAMESVGDVNQSSILKSLDLLKETTQLDITKPGTILNFLKEKADLDGQTLANEIIRRASSQNP